MAFYAQWRAAPWDPARWPHFSPREIACRCGGRFCDGAVVVDAEVLDGLERVRALVGRALIITSGHRCAQWNAAVGGAPLSRHRQLAVDIALAGHDRHALRAHAITQGFTGLGLGRGFLHLDRRARPATWTYPGSKDLWRSGSA